jgi:hypothetical protein
MSPEEELRRAGDARQILEAPIFIEARAHIDKPLADLRHSVPIGATDMHTRHHPDGAVVRHFHLLL